MYPILLRRHGSLIVVMELASVKQTRRPTTPQNPPYISIELGSVCIWGPWQAGKHCIVAARTVLNAKTQIGEMYFDFTTLPSEDLERIFRLLHPNWRSESSRNYAANSLRLRRMRSLLRMTVEWVAVDNGAHFSAWYAKSIRVLQCWAEKSRRSERIVERVELICRIETASDDDDGTHILYMIWQLKIPHSGELSPQALESVPPPILSLEHTRKLNVKLRRKQWRTKWFITLSKKSGPVKFVWNSRPLNERSSWNGDCMRLLCNV